MRAQAAPGFDADAVAERLAAGVEAMRLALAAGVEARLITYLRLLVKWNAAYRLSGVRDPVEMVATHVLDSLSVLAHLQGERCLDIGTGAGLPGLVLAIADGGRRWTLLDASAKKVAFCRQVALELGLGHVEAVHARIEAHAPRLGYDTATTRATFTPQATAAHARHLLAADGVLVCMCGQQPGAEAVDGYARAEVVRVEVPGVERRHLLKLFPA